MIPEGGAGDVTAPTTIDVEVIFPVRSWGVMDPAWRTPLTTDVLARSPVRFTAPGADALKIAPMVDDVPAGDWDAVGW
jgi:hypothetical protein